MNTSDFHYHLPERLIAQAPPAVRGDSRMLVVHRQEQRLEHRQFSDLPAFLARGDLLVVNDTRVIPARIYATKAKSGGRVELLMLEDLGHGEWAALLRASRRPAIGDYVNMAGGRAQARVMEEGEKGWVRLQITSDDPFLEVLEAEGEPPLPPYIKRTKADARALEDDRDRYQTVFARDHGAVAAPTAGLHFSEDSIAKLEQAHVDRVAVTLHVGLGTFRPVSAERVEDHTMEAERYTVGDEAARRIQEAHQGPGRVVAVGSTVVRTLETVMAEHGAIVPCKGRSSLFIRSPYQPSVVDAMLTNFHLPKSTLLMMVCALVGYDLAMRAYREAVEQEYRFFSYGDCMLIL